MWALGVKEVWKVAKPLDRVIHTMGWPLRAGRKYREFGGSFVYPMGEDMVTLGLVVGLDYRDAELSVHDLLQELKTHPLIRAHPRGRRARRSGARRRSPRAASRRCRSGCTRPGLLLAGDGVGLVNVPALKGIHYAIESGRLAAEAAFAALQPGTTPSDAGRARRLRRVAARQLHLARPLAGAQHAPGLRPRLLDGRRARRRGDRDPRLPAAGARRAPSATPSSELIRTDRAQSYPAPDGELTFDKLSSVFASGNRTRDDQPSHIRIQRQVPRDLAQLWARMCPAQVYEVGEEDGDGTVTVEVTRRTASSAARSPPRAAA